MVCSILGTFCIMAFSWSQHVYKGKPVKSDTILDSISSPGEYTAIRLKSPRLHVSDSATLYQRADLFARYRPLRNSANTISPMNERLQLFFTYENARAELRLLPVREYLYTGNSNARPLVYKRRRTNTQETEDVSVWRESIEYRIGNEYIPPRSPMVDRRDRECFSILGVVTHTVGAFLSPQ